MGTTTYSKAASAGGQPIKIGRSAGARHWCFWLAQIALSLALYAAPEVQPSVPGRILIKPKSRLAESDLAGRLNGHGAVQRKKLRHLNVRVVAVAESKTEGVLAALRNDPDIEFAEPDYLAQATFVPNDTYVVSGDAWHLAKIQSPQAWDLTTGRTNVVIAVIDSGINTAHPDLAGRVRQGYDFLSGGTDTSDELGHGTAVAGTVVAAGNNGIGVAGVAYDCTVLPIKVMGTSGLAAYSTVAEGVEYAVNNGARIINLSLAGSSPSLTLQSAINYAWSNNVVVVAAAGNNANDVPQYPAACEYVVAVAATASDDFLAWFSSYGSFLTLSAPGDNIWTTQGDPLNPYGVWSGTSFASPVVAGIAALIASANPSLSNTQIVDLLERTADDLGPAGYDTTFGYGRVNAFRAVSVASGEPSTTPPVPKFPPMVSFSSPADSAEFTTNVITLSGTAVDNMRVEQVLVRLNSGSFQSATVARPKPNTANWITPLTLVAGINTVEVKAVDSLGNESALVSRNFLLPVPALLLVRTSGNGGVTPNLDGVNLLVGRAYTMSAVPGMNWLFTNWVSIVDGVTNVVTNTSRITFLMRTNLELVANFRTNAFIGAAGTYYGLFSDPSGVAHQSAGWISFKTDSRQKFSGKIMVEGENIGFAGSFDMAGMGTLKRPVVRKGLANLPINIVPRLDLTGGGNITGSVSNSLWSATLLAAEQGRPPANAVGQHTVILPGSTNAAAEPAGDGLLLIAVGADGVVKAKGNFGDGEKAKVVKVPTGRTGEWPFYAPLYVSSRGAYKTYRGSVLGWLTFTNSPDTTVAGDLFWNKAAGWTSPYYVAGFTNQITVLGSRYMPPMYGRAVAVVNGLVTLEYGNLSSPISNTFAYDNLGKIVFYSNPNQIALSVSAKNAEVTGSFMHPATSAKTKIHGAVLQNRNVVRGLFTGGTETGSVKLQGN